MADDSNETNHSGDGQLPLQCLPTQKMEPSFQSSSCNNADTSSPTYFSNTTESSYLSSSLTNFATDLIKFERCEEDFTRPLNQELKFEIQNLEKKYASKFSGFSEEQARKFVEKPRNADDMTDILIQRLIKFVKKIPEFKSLVREDQICLLKEGSVQILVWRSAIEYDPTSHKRKVKQMQDLKEHIIDPASTMELLGTDVYKEHKKFVHTLHQVTMSNITVMTLMLMIELFSPDRPNLKNVEVVTRAQEKFTYWLQRYLESFMTVSEARTLYPKLLMMLLDVQKIAESSAKLASYFDITKLEDLHFD